MFRGTTVKALVALLAAALLALPLLTPAECFATAHKARHAEAKTQSGTKLSGKALRDTSTSPRPCDPSGDPTGPLRARDRHRAADLPPQGIERPLPAQDRTDPPPPSARAALTLPRPSAAHSPAALQVFRC
ncbi:hypothetical protein [Streptomyces sp. BK239]|uniref:hypothetical protein n=1 Tax=Streptomyces sp. BK239 TaxID=2512155 RepID=UPI00102BD348|nr:hypothetical protein [Streptomyces sp. BK239]RZU23990.1 hypothetical protein EV567_1728 [Streptomyces sp. BK239]